MTDDEWVKKAKVFEMSQDLVGALSSARNALRISILNLEAWQIGCEVLLAQGRHHKARLFAKVLRRIARKLGNREKIKFAEKKLIEIEEYFQTSHRFWGQTDLTHFAAVGNLKKVQELLQKGADPDEKNKSGWTALHCVAMRGQAVMAKFLIKHGANMEVQDELNETPLITACRFGNIKVVPVLLKLGANVNHVAKEKHTALWYAISSTKNLRLVKQLIAAGSDPHEEYEHSDNPFLLAVQAQKRQVVDYLFELSNDLSRMNKHGVCALHFAASYNDVRLLSKLLQRKVEVNQKTPYGQTALMRAAENNSLRAAQVLLEHGASKTIKSQNGDTALSLAQRREFSKMVKLLNG